MIFKRFREYGFDGSAYACSESRKLFTQDPSSLGIILQSAKLTLAGNLLERSRRLRHMTVGITKNVWISWQLTWEIMIRSLF